MKIKPPLRPVRVRSMHDLLMRDSEIIDLMVEVVPGLNAIVYCPVCTGEDRRWSEATVSSQIVHLNDDHGWSLVRLAEWLDTLDTDLSVRTDRRPPIYPPDPF